MPNKKEKKNTRLAVDTIVSYCKRYWLLLVIAVLCAAASAVFSVISPDYISQITATIQNGIGITGVNIDMGEIARIGGILITMYGAGGVLGYLQAFLLNYISCNMGKKMRSDISGKINRTPLNYYDTHNFGDTLSRVTNDVDTVSQSVNSSIVTLVSAVVTFFGCMIMMFATEWRMALTAIGSSLVGFLLMGGIMGKSQKYFSARQQSLAEVNAHIEEYYAGQNIVRAYNAEPRNLALFQESNEKLRRHTLRAEFLSGLMMPFMGFVGNLGYVAVCIVGAALAFGGSIQFSVVVAFMLYVRLFTSPLSQLAQGVSGMQSAVAASRRVAEFLAEEEMSDESGKTEKLDQVKGDVAFDHISFGYTPDKTIIHDFSAEIKAGQKVAIVGPTGAGKTTLVNLLMRFYELNKGHIFVDGVPLDSLTRENIHDIFGMVLQDTWLFEGSIRDNLNFGKTNISDEKLMEICRQCGLKHFVDTLPEGLDTVLSDNLTVSAGQKQLLTIARAMAENAPVLILDEATSSVDTRTEAKIQKAMNALTAGRTSFVIAHRLSTIKDADLILYMEGGDVKETGNHETLMNLHGRYETLYNSQFA